VRQIDGRADENRVGRVAVRVLDEASVDLEFVDREIRWLRVSTPTASSRAFTPGPNGAAR
jgi:hypothetical protein